jgi:hypothetical protein
MILHKSVARIVGVIGTVIVPVILDVHGNATVGVIVSVDEQATAKASAVEATHP